MMRKLMVLTLAAGTALAGFGAPVNVAAGYPDWQVNQKGHVFGRELCPSDLRQRMTVVIEFEGSKAKTQLPSVAWASAFIHPVDGGESIAWEHATLNRDILVVFSDVDAKGDNEEAILGTLKSKDNQQNFRAFNTFFPPIYRKITFPGAPVATKYPFAYLMGPESTEPLWKGAADETARGAIQKAMSKAKNKSENAPTWKPFYGYVAEPKFFLTYPKALAKGKTLDAETVKFKKAFGAKDEEKAKEAQILYDAVEQAKSDLKYRILLEAKSAPYRAAYDLALLLKTWPQEKKKYADLTARLKGDKELSTLAGMYTKTLAWQDENFFCKNAGEANKIVAELKKMKNDLAKLKESKNIIVQNGALLLETDVDTLIELMPSKLAVK